MTGLLRFERQADGREIAMLNQWPVGEVATESTSRGRVRAWWRSLPLEIPAPIGSPSIEAARDALESEVSDWLQRAGLRVDRSAPARVRA